MLITILLRLLSRIAIIKCAQCAKLKGFSDRHFRTKYT